MPIVALVAMVIAVIVALRGCYCVGTATNGRVLYFFFAICFTNAMHRCSLANDRKYYFAIPRYFLLLLGFLQVATRLTGSIASAI